MPVDKAVATVVSEFVRTYTSVAFDDETDLFKAGIVDSFAFVELIALLESQFGIEVRMERTDIGRFRSVSTISAFVEEMARCT